MFSYMGETQILWLDLIIFVTMAGMTIACIVLLILAIRKKCYIESMVVIISLGVYLGIVCIVRKVGHPQMAICGFLILAFGLYIVGEKNVSLRIGRFLIKPIYILAIFSCATIPSTMFSAGNDLFSDISQSKEAANYLIENCEDGAVVMVHQGCDTPAIYAYVTGKREDICFNDLDKKEEFRFFQWGKEYEVVSKAEIAKIYSECSMDGRDVYYIGQPVDVEMMSVVFHDDRSNRWEEYCTVCRLNGD